MIAFVRGTVASVGLSSAVLEVGGVGLELHCTPDTLAGLRRGAPAELPTSTCPKSSVAGESTSVGGVAVPKRLM